MRYLVRELKGGFKTRRKIRGGQLLTAEHNQQWLKRHFEIGGRKTRRGGQNKIYVYRQQYIPIGGRKTRRKTRGGSESNHFNNPYWNPKQ